MRYIVGFKSSFVTAVLLLSLRPALTKTRHKMTKFIRSCETRSIILRKQILGVPDIPYRLAKTTVTRIS